jgi:hypothetical protein
MLLLLTLTTMMTPTLTMLTMTMVKSHYCHEHQVAGAREESGGRGRTRPANSHASHASPRLPLVRPASLQSRTSPTAVSPVPHAVPSVCQHSCFSLSSSYRLFHHGHCCCHCWHHLRPQHHARPRQRSPCAPHRSCSSYSSFALSAYFLRLGVQHWCSHYHYCNSCHCCRTTRTTKMASTLTAPRTHSHALLCVVVFHRAHSLQK